MEQPEYIFNPKTGVDLPFESVKLPFGYLIGRMVLIRIKKGMNPVDALSHLELDQEITKVSLPDLCDTVPTLLSNRQSAVVHIPDLSCSVEAFNRLRDDVRSLRLMCQRDHKTLYIVTTLEYHCPDPYTRQYVQFKDLDLQMQADIILDVTSDNTVQVTKNRLLFETTQQTIYSEPKP